MNRLSMFLLTFLVIHDVLLIGFAVFKLVQQDVGASIIDSIVAPLQAYPDFLKQECANYVENEMLCNRDDELQSAISDEIEDQELSYGMINQDSSSESYIY
ncbi:MAG: hypothetical protein EZS28_017132 [Streblomastix strix]|uniref:Uncharacterized protein n=1 Tax=Streblomastix strix TaxID=222440 RepID=A0A5J4VY62_9EUKA|nr:MAG: hypothetical protein EZS28_017132 [Streblomastix strix]